MARPSSAADSDSSSSYKTVFVDTNLDTHFALSVCVSDTVSDVKKKILSEHRLCFPKVGEIEIHALKVKRKGLFYHLSDTICLKNAFDGVKANWYLYVDASTLLERSDLLHSNPNSDNPLACIHPNNKSSTDGLYMLDGVSRWLANINGSSLLQIEHNPCANQEVPITERFCSGESSGGSSKDLMIEVKRISDNLCEIASADTDHKPDLEKQNKHDTRREDHGLPDKQTECIDNTRNRIIDVQHNLLLEGTKQNKPTGKKNKTNKPTKKNDDAVLDLASKENDAVAGEPGIHTSQQDVVVPEHSFGDADMEAEQDSGTENGSIVQDHFRSSNLDASMQLGSGVQKSNDLSKGIEASVRLVDGNNDKSENGVVDVQCNKLLDEISVQRSPAKKKRKRSGSGTENDSIVQDPCRSSNLDAGKQLGSGVQKSNDVSKGIEASVHQVDGNNDKSENGVIDVQCIKLLGEISEQSSPAKKKRKRLGSGVKKTNNQGEGIEVSVPHVDSQNEKSEKGIVDIQCNNLFGDISISVHSSPAKKQDTEKNSYKDAFKDMTAPENSLGEEHRNVNVTSEGLSAVCTEDTPSLLTSSSTGKKKRKKKLSDSRKADAAICSPVEELREESAKGDVEIDHKDMGEPEAAVTGENVLGETILKVDSVSLREEHDDPMEVVKGNVPCSLDVDMGDANPNNVGAETDVSGGPAALEVKKMDTSCDVEVKDRPPSAVQKPNDLQLNNEADQTNVIEEAREMHQNDNHKVVTPVAANSCKKEKKSRKTKKAGRGTEVVSTEENAKDSITGIGSTEIYKSVKGDNSSNKSKNDEVILSQTEGNDVSKIKTDAISLMTTVGETEKRTPAEVTSLQEISKSQAVGQNVDMNKKKKTKKKQTVATNLPEVQEKEQDVGLKVNASSKRAKKNKSIKSSSSDPNLVPAKNTFVATDPLDTELVSGTVNISQVQSLVVESNDEGKAEEAVGNVNSLNMDEDNSQQEVFDESNGINFKDYFVHSQDEKNVKSAGEVIDKKLIREKKFDKERKANNNSGKVAANSVSALPNQQSLSKVSQNRGSKRKSEGGNSSTIEPQGSSLKESSEPLIQSNQKPSKGSGSGMMRAPPNNSTKFNSVSEESRKPNIPNASGFSTPLGKNIEVFAKPSSSLESSKGSRRTKKSNKHQSHNDFYSGSVRKASGGNFGEVVNKTERKKSLLTSSGAIFKDDSSKSSFDDQAGIDSDASTRTPSNNLSSSDGSDGESNANLNSSQNGSYSSKREEGGKRNSAQSRSTVPKSMTLDAILRSSSRYKKAKQNASQSQVNETESQPVDFVPDSQAEA